MEATSSQIVTISDQQQKKKSIMSVFYFIGLFFICIGLPVFLIYLSHSHILDKKFSASEITAIPMNHDSIITTNPSLIKHVFLIVMENKNWKDVKDAASAPYINKTILPQASYTSEYYNPPGLHPSLRNYLWLEAGTDFGVQNDNNPDENAQSTPDHLTTMLSNHGISWKSYQEGIDGTTCPLKQQGLYAPKHNPMVYFKDITDDNSPTALSCILHVRPYDEFTQDITNNTVPRYSFITPDLCDDMHDKDTCDEKDQLKNGDTWLSQNLPQILNSKAYKDGGVIFITFDEGDGGKDGPIGMMVLSEYAKGKGYTNTIHYTHSSTLKTLQEIFDVKPLLGDAANADDLSDLFMSASDLATKPTIVPVKKIAQKPSITKSVTKKVVTVAPTKIPATHTPAPTAIVQQWNIYQSGSDLYDAGFTFSTGPWGVVYKKEKSNYLQLHFYLSPSAVAPDLLNPENIDDKAGILVAVLGKANTPEEVMEMYYPTYKDKVVIEKYTTIGNKIMYRVSPKQNLPSNDSAYNNFGEKGIVIGNNHSYTFGFDQGSSTDLIERIQKEIWSSFLFRD